jgi:Pilus formation protein N terminal region
MTIKSKFACLVLGSMLALATGQAFAAEPITIQSDQSQIMTMARAPGTVVVGNPSIADVTVQGKQVFLHGKTYGTTNITILDEAGGQLAMFEVTVQLGGGNNVALFKAGQLASYVCAPDCESSLHIGDDKDYFKNLLSQSSSKIGLATGQKSGESTSPPPQPVQ